MGTYLNPDNVLFQESLDSEIYVDKTELIRYTNGYMNTKNKLICVSRPRRFGKSMALEMLAAYYSKGCCSRTLFENLKIAEDSGFEKALNQYDVIWIDMQGVLGTVMAEERTQEELTGFYRKLPDMDPNEREKVKHPALAAMQREIIRDIRENEEYAAYISEHEEFLGNALHAVYRHTGNQFVLLIDEWDCIFRNYENDRQFQDRYVSLFRDLFKNTKFLPAYALVYMTGILPVKRYGTQSALNNFREYTMLEAAPLGTFVGFTESETVALYEQHGLDVDKAREWYDGYQMEDVGHIYNPNSVVESVMRKRFKNFWTATGTYESVKKLIEMDFDGLKEKVIIMLGNGRCKANVSKFQNDMVTFSNADDVLTLLVHLGYLGYDTENEEVYIPNKEIREEFVNAVEGSNWTLTFEAITNSARLLEATLEGEEQTVADCIEKVHQDHTAILTYNNENALSCIIQIAYYQAQDDYMLVREMPSGKGFCDIVFLPRNGVEKPVLIVELKWKKDAMTALDQIKSRDYGSRFADYYGEIMLVGISYDKDSPDKKHTCRIERFRKEKM